jgi:hypothetical protein
MYVPLKQHDIQGTLVYTVNDIRLIYYSCLLHYMHTLYVCMHAQVMLVCTANPLNYLQVNKNTYSGSSSSSNKHATTYRVSDVGLKFLRDSSALLPGSFKPPLDFINAVQLCRARVAAAANYSSGSSGSGSASAAMVNVNSMFQSAIQKGT